jgi:hypothetical protein
MSYKAGTRSPVAKSCRSVSKVALAVHRATSANVAPDDRTASPKYSPMDGPSQGCGRDRGRSRRDYARRDQSPLPDIRGRASLLGAQLRKRRATRTAVDPPAGIPYRATHGKVIARPTVSSSVRWSVISHDMVLCGPPSHVYAARPCRLSVDLPARR